MNDDEAQVLYDKLVEYYGDKLANFEHYPKTFEFQVKMYKYYTQPRETTNEN
jgi:hypothetical protein